MTIENVYAAALALSFGVTSVSALAQASVASLADYKKKQDDGIAEAVRQSQSRAQAGKLAMGNAGGKAGKGQPTGRGKPGIIRVGVHPRQTGIDNRRGMNVR